MKSTMRTWLPGLIILVIVLAITPWWQLQLLLVLVATVVTGWQFMVRRSSRLQTSIMLGACGLGLVAVAGSTIAMQPKGPVITEDHSGPVVTCTAGPSDPCASMTAGK